MNILYQPSGMSGSTNSTESLEKTKIDQFNDRYGELLKDLGVKVKKLSVIEGLNLGNVLQTRYTLIPKRGLSKETVGGIWDKSLGKKGKAIIRFDNGRKNSPHINIDPKGFPGKKNPHIKVPKGVVKGAQVFNSTMKYAGPILMVAAVAVDTYRFGCSVKDDLKIQENADEILRNIDDILSALNEIRDMKEEEESDFPWFKEEEQEDKDEEEGEDEEEEEEEEKYEDKDKELEDEESDKESFASTEPIKGSDEELPKSDELCQLDEKFSESEEIKKAEAEFNPQTLEEILQLIETFRKLRKEIQLAKDKIPYKTIKTGSSIGGGWIGGSAGALGGGWAGMQTGAAIGTLFGPAGTAVGGFFGAVVGSIGAGIAGGVGGSLAAEAVADIALEAVHDKNYENKELQEKSVIPLKLEN